MDFHSSFRPFVFGMGIILWLISFHCQLFKEKIEPLKATGRIEAIDVDITAKSMGEITKLNVAEGAYVKKGELIAEIDPEPLTLRLKQAEIALELAQASYVIAKTGARDEDLNMAAENIKLRDRSLANFNKELGRMASLLKENAAPAQKYDTMKTQYDLAKIQLSLAYHTYAKLRKGLRDIDLKMYELNIKNARAAMAVLKRQIADCTIISPVSGVVTHKFIELGENVGLNQPVITVSQLKEVDLKVYIAEKYLGKIKLGQSVQVKIDSFPDRKFIGQLFFIADEAEFTPKTVQTEEERVKLMYAVKIKLDNKEKLFKRGMPAEVYFENIQIKKGFWDRL